MKAQHYVRLDAICRRFNIPVYLMPYHTRKEAMSWIRKGNMK